MDFVIKCEHLGLNTPTTVYANDRVLTTQFLDIQTLCDLWKWYFHIPPFAKIKLIMSAREYNATQQRPLQSALSAQELLQRQGVYCEKENV
jgi:hypothetical protein